MNITLLTFGLALSGAVGFVIILGLLSLLSGVLDTFLGKPKLTFLKSSKGEQGFAFSLNWNNAKQTAKFDTITLRLFNAFGNPTQVTVIETFKPNTGYFYEDIDMGPAMLTFKKAQGFDDALVSIEISSSKDGIKHEIQLKGKKYKEKVSKATRTVSELDQLAEEKKKNEPVAISYGGVQKQTVADTVPGLGPQLKIPTNPAFAGEFAAAAAGAAVGEAAPAVENFKVAKVWIAEGCIVCNACEDIYPEVFDVQSDTCVIKPNPPLDDGLKIQEAAEACPVEVIKFDKA